MPVGLRNWRQPCGRSCDLPVQPGADHGGDQADRSPLGLNQWHHNGSLRKGHDGLAALVKNELHKDPFTGTVFVFRSRRADRLKLLYWNGTGLVMAYKRLEEHTFTWPAIHAEDEAVDPAKSGPAKWTCRSVRSTNINTLTLREWPLVASRSVKQSACKPLIHADSTWVMANNAKAVFDST